MLYFMLLALLAGCCAGSLQHEMTGASPARVTLTRTTGPVQTFTQTLHEVATTVKHRPWKSPHGSPSHIYTKSSTDHEAVTSKDVSKDSTFASITKDMETSGTTLPITSASCSSFGPDATATELPAVLGSGGHLLRNTCGVTDATVSECPYLCNSSSTLPLECHDSDISLGVGPMPIVCIHCLPPCKSGTDKDGSQTKDKDAMIKHRRWKSPHGSPSHKDSETPSTKTLTPPKTTCTPIEPGSTDTPAIQRPDLSLARVNCGVTNVTVSECPWLCLRFRPDEAYRTCYDQEIISEFTDLCEQCLPPCTA